MEKEKECTLEEIIDIVGRDKDYLELINKDEEPKIVEIDFSNLPLAFGKHVFPNFISFLGEFIDNSISAASSNRKYFSIEILIEEITSKSLHLTITDQSGGIEESHLPNLIFNPACCPPKRGFLNNHGVGLKQALYVQQYRNKANWSMLTYTDSTIMNGYGLLVEGPLINKVTQIKKVSLPKDTKISGTSIWLEIKDEMFTLFEDLYRHKSTPYEDLLEKRVYRLHEILGWHYSPSLRNGNSNIIITYKPLKSPQRKEVIYPLDPIWQDGNDIKNVTQLSKDFEIKFEGKAYKFNFKCGNKQIEQKFIHTEEFRRKTPNWHIYPTKIYKRVPANAGIDVTVGGDNGKRICRIPLKDIFGTDTSKLSYESYHGELTCPLGIPDECTNNVKNTINHYHPVMSQLFEKIREVSTLNPKDICGTLEEKDLYEPLLNFFNKIDKDKKAKEQFQVASKIKGCESQKVDFLVKRDDNEYQVIEVALILDINHIYKVHYYRTAIENGWSEIDITKKPKLTYKLIAKITDSNKNLDKFCEKMGIIWEDPTIEYNINYDALKQDKEEKKRKKLEG
jgi:hypothetical protein